MGTEDADVAVPSLSLRDFIQVLRRRKLAALATFVVIVSLVAINTLLTKAQYKSTASLLLENPNGSSSNASSQIPSIFGGQDSANVEGQVQLLNSPLILDKVYEKTRLARGSVQVAITRVERTSKIDIVGVSTSRQGVQEFVNTIPDVYRENRRVESARQVTSELEFAQKDLAQETQKLTAGENALTDFKNRYNLFDPDSEAAAALEAAATSRTNLGAARADLSSLSAQIGALQSELATLPPTIDTPVVTTNPLLQDLKNQLAALKSDRKNKSFLYKESADPIRQIDLQIASLNARIANTAPSVTNKSTAPNPDVATTASRIAGLRADLSAKQASVRVLAAQVAQQEKGLGRYTTIQRQQSELQRQIEANLAAVKSGTENVRQLSVRARAMEQSGATITLLQPGTPGFKIAPNPVRNMILALFVGFLAACAVALVQDSLDDRVRDEEEVRHLLGAPVLGHFPLLPASNEHQILDLNKPDRLSLESFRALRSNVQFALVNSAGKKLQVTSTVPGEGKSYIASNLAITMALDGRRVILVDADLHRPTAHARFGVKRQPGLTNVLVGELSVQDALQDVGLEGLKLLSAGALPPNPAELLNSPAMVEVMRELEAMADLVIFDTPPLLATSDSQLMSAKMDGVIFVMQMGSVARSGSVRAFELLKQANANLVGVVFNKVDKSSGAALYGSYSGHYALESIVAPDEVLNIPNKTLPSGPHSSPQIGAGNGSANSSHADGNHPNGASTNGSRTNGNHANGSRSEEPTTVFDDAISSDENQR